MPIGLVVHVERLVPAVKRTSDSNDTKLFVAWLSDVVDKWEKADQTTGWIWNIKLFVDSIVCTRQYAFYYAEKYSKTYFIDAIVYSIVQIKRKTRIDGKSKENQ